MTSNNTSTCGIFSAVSRDTHFNTVWASGEGLDRFSMESFQACRNSLGNGLLCFGKTACALVHKAKAIEACLDDFNLEELDWTTSSNTFGMNQRSDCDLGLRTGPTKSMTSNLTKVRWNTRRDTCQHFVKKSFTAVKGWTDSRITSMETPFTSNVQGVISFLESPYGLSNPCHVMSSMFIL